MVKLLSERTLDNKTITLTDQKDAIEVQISKKDGNALKVVDDGLLIESKDLGATLLIQSLGGEDLGLIVPKEP